MDSILSLKKRREGISLICSQEEDGAQYKTQQFSVFSTSTTVALLSRGLMGYVVDYSFKPSSAIL